MCDYCSPVRDKALLGDTKFLYGREQELDFGADVNGAKTKGRTWRIVLADPEDPQDGPAIVTFSGSDEHVDALIKINFCPMCGRRIRRWDWNREGLQEGE